jgi:integrative and conjugative element protein (TIGR02256 family)
MSTRLEPIRMSTAAFESIAAEAPNSSDGRETGGALFGFDASTFGPPLITHASGPGPKAIRKRDFFLRDRAYTERQAEVAYTACCARWIGEWHTHPLGLPAPSERDLASYLTHLDDPELSFATFLSLIVVPKDGDWTRAIAVAWEISAEALWPRNIDLTPYAAAKDEALRRATPPSEEGENA